MNLYAYVGNDPVNATDPSGLCGTRIRGEDGETRVSGSCWGITTFDSGGSGAGRGSGVSDRVASYEDGGEQYARPLPVISGNPHTFVGKRSLSFEMPEGISGIMVTVWRYGDPVDHRGAAQFGRALIRNLDEAAEMLERQSVETFLSDMFLPDTVVTAYLSTTRMIDGERHSVYRQSHLVHLNTPGSFWVDSKNYHHFRVHLMVDAGPFHLLNYRIVPYSGIPREVTSGMVPALTPRW